MTIEQEVRERHFTEQLALVFEQSGMPPMYGRVLARLLICDPPQQSLTELADYLAASKGAVSLATRSLQQMGLLERVPVPGARGVWFRLKPNAFSHVLALEMERLHILCRVANEGLEMLRGSPPDRRARLQEMRDMYVFFEEEFPAILARWNAKRGAP